MGRIFSVFLFFVLALAGLFILKRESISLVSPIPRVFGTNATVENNWFPKKTLFKSSKNSSLVLSAKSALVVNYDTGEIVFAKNIDERLPVASTVKIMTALIALENAELSDKYPVSEKATKVGENSMGLTFGEKLTLAELLYGLMLVSGNDAAISIAEGIAGTESEFVKLMNAKVKSLGLGDTRFVNASGLEEDGSNQYSTAYDLVTIARYVWEKYPKFGEITSTYNKFIEASRDHKAFDFYNDTNLLTTYPGVRGIKPGFTPEAGLCLVTYAENGGKKLLAVILGSDDRRGEMKELLDYGFFRYGIKVEHPGLDL